MRLATFNILHGRSPADGVVDLDRFGEAITALDPDVLALQEVDRAQTRSHRADLTAVAAEAMGAVVHRFAAALLGTPGASWRAAAEDDDPGTPAYGVSLLSRYPGRSWRVLPLPTLPLRVPRSRWTPRRLTLRREEPRTALIAELDSPYGPLVVANTHLSFVPGWGQRQLRRLRTVLAATPGPAVLMGDLNMGGRLAVRLTGYAPLARHSTFPAPAPARQLDHILLRGRLAPVLASEALELPVSDHRALVVQLAEPARAA